MKPIAIVSAVRTPVGKFQGALKSLTAPQLGALVVKTVVERAGLEPQLIDEVIMGNVVSAGLGQNPARQAALRGGLLPDVAAMTINKVCGSGLKAVALAAQAIQCGDAEVVVAGGMESMSNVPYYLTTARSGMRMGHQSAQDGMIVDGLWDPYNDFHMGAAADLCAREKKISREAQDAYAAESYRRALDAQKSGRFSAEIVPVAVPQKKGQSKMVALDEDP